MVKDDCEPGMWYCVVQIRTGLVQYLGRNLSKAAGALGPGRLYGKARSEQAALAAALRQRNELTEGPHRDGH